MIDVFDNAQTGAPCTVAPSEGHGRLNEEFGRLSAVSFTQDDVLDGMVAHLRAGMGEVTVGLRGAQVLRWHPTPTSKDVLWMSPSAKLSADKPLRGGVPICWPWFGAHETDSTAPTHGLARTSDWLVASTAVSDKATGISLQLTEEAAASSHWPDGAHVVFDVRLGDELMTTLTVVNTGSRPIEMTEALHTYLRVGDIANVKISGLEMRPFLDQLAQTSGHSEPHAISIEGEIDRIYNDTAQTITVEDRSLGRVIRVRKEGSQSTVIWNPWQEKAEQLGDMGRRAYREMVCVETANVGSDKVVLPSGGVHRIATTLTVQPIAGAR